MKCRFPRLFIPFLMAISMITLSSCSGNQADELFKTAQFEELQNNREHARKLYGEIIRKYPGSEEAKKAEDRLAELGK
jgi:TolA-binding protein